ncbi:MAG: SusD/RagB family nutrient-binding outer membrane lipoprotein [Prevotellaceae bacterium]|jgi:hypothetical protein|nr:SusD/RagB family nutrient-binding outer membrane lipoprotein [Prevotellaceae bacterium]
MKKFKYIALSIALIAGLSSCSDWLDVNVDPDNPNSASALIENQLPWVQHFYQYTAAGVDFNTALTSGVYYSNRSQWFLASVTWAFDTSNLTQRANQCWYVYCNSLPDIYSKAEESGSYHYMGAANTIYAMGFMMMLDLYGEIPFRQAWTETASPAYDDGKTIFNACIQKLDDAIELFQREQASGSTSFAGGDYWFNGDAGKWIKFCYGLKARYLLRLSKKAEFNPQEILDCLDKALQSNADNAIGVSYNISNDQNDWYYGDPINANCHFSWVSNWTRSSSATWFTKYYCDLLTNMRDAHVEDPRMTKIIPSTMSNIRLGSSGQVVSNDWQRSQGVDVHEDATRLIEGGGARSLTWHDYVSVDGGKTIAYTIKDTDERNAFINNMAGKQAYTVEGDVVSVTYRKGAIYVNNADYHMAGDTVYTNLLANSAFLQSQDEKDVSWYFDDSDKAAYNAGAVGSTGTYQLRPCSDFELLTYAEMCFIKAEVYLRQNNSAQALEAYKEGIQAHIDMMQNKLQEWQAAGYKNNPDMLPMDQQLITTYMSSDAVCQIAGELKMSDIMLQKYLAMGCSLENWNDMRRFNFSAGNVGSFGVVYPGFDRSPLFQGDSQLPGTSKTDINYWPRRWRLPATIELDYNTNNALAINPHADDNDIWGMPVWWDCASDEEYYNYLK